MYYNDYNRMGEQQPVYQGVSGLPVPAQTKKRHTGIAMAALCLVFALAGGMVGAAFMGASTGTFFPDKTTIYQSNRTPTAVEMARVDGSTPLTVAQVYNNNLASVVGVNGDVKTNYWGQVVSNPVAGSGFVITENGYILTNYHVIDGVDDLKVSFADGKTYAATLVGGEEANDIAVLKIEAEGLTPVVVGSSDDLKVGEQVVAIGNPLGELTFTLTAGYVSALDRNIKMDDGNVINVMQTDAAINSGNSGGPLFNIYGECIGITNAKYSNNGSTSASIEGIGFAIPIDDVIDMVTSIIEKGYVTGKPNVGIIMEDVSSEAVRRYGIPQGAYVSAVLDGSCAQKAGLQVGDVITAIGDDPVTSSDGLRTTVKSYHAGDTVTFSVYRSGETLTLTLTLDEYDQARLAQMEKLQEDYQQQYQQSQQETQQQQSNGWYDRDFGWPFSWGW